MRLIPFQNVKGAVLQLLNLKELPKNAEGKVELSEENKKTLDNFQAGFSAKFLEALAKEDEGNTAIEAKDAEIAALAAQAANTEAARAELASKVAALEAEKESITASFKAQLEAKNTEIAKLILLPEAEEKPKGATPNPENMVVSAKDTHLFGVNEPLMAIDASRPYNMRAHAALLANQGIQMAVPVARSIDYKALNDDLGEFYRTQKQKQIQSFLLQLPSLDSIFPHESGYQDEDVLVNMFMGEFSQADNTESDFDNVVKGDFDIRPEKIKMASVMFSHKFKELKKLEKSWIGYLNQEGSSTMKWSFIQFILVETGKVLHNEQQIRRVKGVRKEPELNKPGTAMGAADGILEFIRKKIANFQIKPFELGEWTNSTIANYIFEGTQRVPEVIRNTGKLAIYCSSNAVTQYNKNREALYGVNHDYKADIKYVAEYPNVEIIAVPGWDDSKRMVWTLKGNFRTLEDQEGEMYQFSVEQQDWTLKVWSNWKECVCAFLVGKKFASAAEQDYDHQMIFCNDVDLGSDTFVPTEKDNATPSVLRHTSIMTVTNTDNLAITDILDAPVGKLIRVKLGNAAKTVTFSGAKFSLLPEAITLTKVGEIVEFKKRSDGKFIFVRLLTEVTAAKQIAVDDATPDVTGGTVFVTADNANATAITTLDNAVTGVVYTLHGCGVAHPSTIANAGNFVLTDAMTLSNGTFITLEKMADGKFYELTRG